MHAAGAGGHGDDHPPAAVGGALRRRPSGLLLPGESGRLLLLGIEEDQQEVVQLRAPRPGRQITQGDLAQLVGALVEPVPLPGVQPGRGGP